MILNKLKAIHIKTYYDKVMEGSTGKEVSLHLKIYKLQKDIPEPDNGKQIWKYVVNKSI